MNGPTHKLRLRIMKRIFGIWLLRHTFPLLVFELVVLFVTLSFFAKLIFVEKVVANALTAALGNPLKLFLYLISAFLGTALFTQIVILTVAAAIILILRDINRSLISYLTFKRDQLMTDTQ